VAWIHSSEGEVGPGRGGDRGCGQVELVGCLDDGEGRGLEAGSGVGVVAGGDFGLDQGAEHLFGCPALGLGRDEQLGRELTHRGELEAAQARGQVGVQGRDGRGAHEDTAVGAYSVNDRGCATGEVHDEGVPGRARAGHAEAGLQDGADVTGFPPSERDRSFPALRVTAASPWAAVRAFRSASSGPRRVWPAAAAPAMNASAAGPSAQNCCSATVLGRIARTGVAGRGPS
jgi:hypothetical protein